VAALDDTIVFLLGIIVMMWFADDIGKPTIGLFALIALLMVAGWYVVRGRIDSDLLETGILSGDPVEAEIEREDRP